MGNKDLSNYDASHRAGNELDTVLRSVTQNLKPEKKITVTQALQQKPLAKIKIKRSAVRVLFISQDTTLLNPATQSLDGFLDLKDMFEEVHILILRTGIPARNPALRVEENVWMYTATSKSWISLAKAGEEFIENQLVFASGFRPDLIVARDPFESALVGKELAKKYDKPLQIHVLKNYTGEKFRKEAAKNFWRRFIPRYTLPAATSVRVDSEAVGDFVKKTFGVPDVELLPKFNSYEALIDAPSTLDLKDKYRPLIFFFLYIGKLDHTSTFFRALDSVRFVLKNPRVGLLVLGEGPAKSEFQKRAKIFGIETQVVFQSGVVDTTPYLKSADILLVTDTSEEANETVLRGAAAGTAVIMSKNEYRQGLFEHNVSAMLCEPEDTQAFTEAASELLNSVGNRSLMEGYAQDVIRQNFHNDAETYRNAYRTSIEQTIFIDRKEDTDEK